MKKEKPEVLLQLEALKKEIRDIKRNLKEKEEEYENLLSSSKLVRIECGYGGYIILCLSNNRPVSKMNKCNEYIPVTYNTVEEAIEACNNKGYTIIGYDID